MRGFRASPFGDKAGWGDHHFLLAESDLDLRHDTIFLVCRQFEPIRWYYNP